MDNLINRVHCSEFFDLARQVPDASIDLYLGDLPYGTTNCAWDSIIPLEPMWAELKRIIKPKGAIVLTANQPFTTALIASNLGMFRYSWVWVKSMATGFLDANRKPLKAFEDVLVFGEKLPLYYPVMAKGDPYKVKTKENRASQYGNHGKNEITNEGTRYPINVLYFDKGNHESKHPTQKPVALFEYLIRTYTRVGELVADFTVGSGTTAVASRNTGRRFIVGDYLQEYVDIANKRLSEPYTPSMFEDDTEPEAKPVTAQMF